MDGRSLRALMGHWPTGVGVVATLAGDTPVGCTLNAFTSVSLDPLEVLICLRRGSATLEASLRHGRFSLCFLAHDQRDLSARFAGGAAADERFEGVKHTLIEGTPVIHGCVAYLVCAIARRFDGGDHEILIGRPVAGNADGDRHPLVFMRSSYHRTVAHA